MGSQLEALPFEPIQRAVSSYSSRLASPFGDSRARSANHVFDTFCIVFSMFSAFLPKTMFLLTVAASPFGGSASPFGGPASPFGGFREHIRRCVPRAHSAEDVEHCCSLDFSTAAEN